MLRGPDDPLAIADWRRRTAHLYSQVRLLAAEDPAGARHFFEAERDALFQSHPSTPLSEAIRSRFTGLSYYPYRSSWRVVGRIEPHVSREVTEVEAGRDGTLTLIRVAKVAFGTPNGDASLDLFWVGGYGGGVFLPFADRTNGVSTFGGGRYLYDTIKGADPGLTAGEIILDFNFAYNPSCAYDIRWVCPLAPPENRLACEVEAGELAP